METRVPDRSDYRPRAPLPVRPSLRTVPLLAVACVLAGCAGSAPARRHGGLPPRGTCEEHVVSGLLERHPGVRVYRGGASLQVRVRGALGRPLYIIDGQPLTPGSTASLSAINPCDISEIRVLTDPADLTFYGVRGANGVIVVTTMRP